MLGIGHERHLIRFGASLTQRRRASQHKPRGGRIQLATILARHAEREQIGRRLITAPVVLLLETFLLVMILVHIRHKINLVL